jgi:hypothetical protein
MPIHGQVCSWSFRTIQVKVFWIHCCKISFCPKEDLAEFPSFWEKAWCYVQLCFPSIGVVVKQIKSLKNMDISVGRFSSSRHFDSRSVIAICVWQMKPPYLLKALIKLWMLELIMGWNGILCQGNELSAGSSLFRLRKSAAQVDDHENHIMDLLINLQKPRTQSCSNV